LDLPEGQKIASNVLRVRQLLLPLARFIQTFSDLTFPLTCLLLKDAKFDWSSKCAVAFDTLKTAFTSFPVLRHYDFDKSCTIETDASDFAIAAVLSQEDTDGSLHPVAYYSRQLLPAEINYDIGDKELLINSDGLRYLPILTSLSPSLLVASVAMLMPLVDALTMS
jgi:hypothetical protein